MYICNVKRSVDSMCAGQKLEQSVGLEVMDGDTGELSISWLQL